MFLSSSIKRWLEKQEWYLRARYAKPILNAWLLLRPSVKRGLQKQEQLYLALLNSVKSSSRLVFDIGANEGFLTDIFEKAGYKVIAVEPAKRNISILKSRFGNNSNIRIVKAAISDKPGAINFFETENAHAFATASNKWKDSAVKNDPGIIYKTESVSVPAFTIDQLISQYGLPCFVKIDVEGYEESALHGLNQKVSLISFEAILPAFMQETENCIKHLRRISSNAGFNFAIDNQLQWEDFSEADKLLNVIKQLPSQTIEVFCKM